MVSRPDGFVVLLPVKSPGTGKTRLASLSDDERGRLAAAFARDTVTACLATPGIARVIVVSDDAVFAAELAELGAETCPDAGGGLNAVLRQASAAARLSSPEVRPVALCADLPALRPDDLAAALDFVASTAAPCFVRDADGTGTTLYTARYDDFDPRFGPGSAQAHTSAGATAVPGDLPGLRRDVDDVVGLMEAVTLGVGLATAEALAGCTLPG